MSVGMVYIERLKGTTDVGPFGVSKQSLVNVLGRPPSRLVSKPWATGDTFYVSIRTGEVGADVDPEAFSTLMSTRMTKREGGGRRDGERREARVTWSLELCWKV